VFNENGDQVVFRLDSSVDNQDSLSIQNYEKTHVAFHKTAAAHNAANPDK